MQSSEAASAAQIAGQQQGTQAAAANMRENAAYDASSPARRLSKEECRAQGWSALPDVGRFAPAHQVVPGPVEPQGKGRASTIYKVDYRLENGRTERHAFQPCDELSARRRIAAHSVAKLFDRRDLVIPETRPAMAEVLQDGHPQLKLGVVTKGHVREDARTCRDTIVVQAEIGREMLILQLVDYLTNTNRPPESYSVDDFSGVKAFDNGSGFGDVPVAGMHLPPLLDNQTMMQVMRISEADLQSALQPLLTREQIQAACVRLANLHAHVRTLVASGRVPEDNAWNDNWGRLLNEFDASNSYIGRDLNARKLSQVQFAAARKKLDVDSIGALQFL